MGEFDNELARTVVVWIRSKTFEIGEFVWVFGKSVLLQIKDTVWVSPTRIFGGLAVHVTARYKFKLRVTLARNRLRTAAR